MDETATSAGPEASGIAALIRQKVGAMTSGKLRRAVALTLATQILSWSMAIGVTFYLPAYLGERNLGTLTLAVGFAATLGVFVSFGTSTVLVQQIARHPYRARELVRTSLLLRSSLGAGMACLGLLATWLLGYDADVRLIVVLVMVATILGQVTETFQSALAGLQEFVRLSSATLSERLTFSAITIALVFLKAPLWQFAAVYLLSNTFSTVIAATAFHRARVPEPPEPREVPEDTPRTLAKAGIPFLATRLFATIYGDGSSALLMSKLSTLEAIGWFGLAKRFSGASQMIPVAIGTAILPTLTRMHSEGDRSGFARMVWRMIGVLIVASLPISVVLVVFPGELLDLLHYPPGFAGSIPVMRLAGGALFIWFVQQAFGTALVASGRNTVFAYVTGLGALLAFPVCGACIWAGERYLQNGAAGAMIGDIVLEVVMLFFYARALLPDLFPNGPGPTVTEPAAAEPAGAQHG